MSAPDRTAAKRRASFARTDRVAKEAAREAERTAAREKADQQRKAEALKAVEQRNALARKRAEQRRMERHRDNLRQEFARKAERQKAEAVRVKAQQQDEKRREAEAQIAQRHKRQQADQQAEHRRQTDRLRVEQRAQIRGYGDRNAAAIDQHARHVRNIDIAERRDLAALNDRRNSLTGRAVALVRGGKHFDRQERAITDRHEAARWDKHRDLEAKKDALFWSEQAARQGHATGRMTLMQRHRDERHELTQTQDRMRPQQIEAQRLALIRANENAPVRAPEQVRTTDAFGHALER